MRGAQAAVVHAQLDRRSLGIDTGKAADRADVATKSALLEDQAQSDRQPEESQTKPRRSLEHR